MEKYILGIDTTFHSSGVGLVDETGKVLVNETLDIDFTNEEANRFYNFHNRSALSLLKPILDKYAKGISLISASSLEGPFHAMPVGAIVANTTSCLLGKPIIGVKHEIAHLHSTWLDRNEQDFSYPITSLSISGARSSVFLLSNSQEIRRISDVAWRSGQEKFGGLGNLFDSTCRMLNMRIKRGEGGSLVENLAESGNPRFENELAGVAVQRKGDNLCFGDIKSEISNFLENRNYFSLNGNDRDEFQKDFSASLLRVLFGSLADSMAEIGEERGAREVHFVGGVASNKLLSKKLADSCRCAGIMFKTPIKSEYCGDNGAMVAISGHLKHKYSGKSGEDKNFLNIETSRDYYKYYTRHYG